MVAGIPDLRLIPDADDLARAKSLAARFDHLDFAGPGRSATLPKGSRLVRSSRLVAACP